MNKAYFITLLFIFSVFCINSSDTFLFVSDPWAPFTIGKEGQHIESGISYDLCNYIFEKLGLNYNSRIYPWQRVLVTLEYGEADFTFPLIRSESRDKFLVFSDVVLIDYGRIWYNKSAFPDGFEWDNIKDLEFFSIGIVKGYSQGKEIDAAIKKGLLDIDTSNSFKQGLIKLSNGRMDIFLGSEIVIKDLIKNNPEINSKNIAYAQKPYVQYNYRIAISKKSGLVKYLTEINKIISEIKDEEWIK